MEKTRTLYRMRRMKNAVMINLFTLTLGIILLSVLLSFESSILSVMREKFAIHKYESDTMSINYSFNVCDKAFVSLKSTATYSILLSIEGLLMVFFLIRMSPKTQLLCKYAPLMLGLGTLSIFCYYFLVALLLPSNGHFESVETTYQILKFSGAILLLISNILFIYQVFIQVVLEKIDQ